MDGDLNLVEVYDPVNEVWRRVADMRTKRSYFGLTVLENHMYAVGGCDGSKELNLVERYDFEKVTIKQKKYMFVCCVVDCV